MLTSAPLRSLFEADRLPHQTETTNRHALSTSVASLSLRAVRMSTMLARPERTAVSLAATHCGLA